MDVRGLQRKGWWTAGILSAALSCRSVAQAQPGVTLLPPAELSAPTAVQAPKNGGMTADQIIATVLTADPKLRVGYEDINQAIAEAITASLPPNPTLSPDYQLIPLTRPFTQTQQGGPPQFDAIVSYPLDWFLFGKRKAAMASTAVGVRKSEAEYYELVRLRIRDAALGFYEILELKALRDLAIQDVESLQRVEAITRRAVEQGGRPAVDLNRIRLDVLRSQQFLRDAEAALNNAKTRLRALLGRNDADANFDVVGSLDLPTLPAALTTDEAIAIAEANRPDLQALRFKVEKAEADTVVEKRKAYPQVNARTGYTRQFQGDIGFRDANSYLVGFDVGLPFFDRNQGGRANAASKLAQSHYELQTGLVDLRSEIEQVQNDYRFAVQSAKAVAEEQLKLAEQVRESINKANEAGGQPLLNVLDAQRNFRETYRIYITSRANYWRASVRLNATLGKKVVP
ncbi:MAG: TolC family protein [Planctomycetota bacterium]